MTRTSISPTSDLKKRTLSSTSSSPISKKLKTESSSRDSQVDADLINEIDQVEGLDDQALLTAAEAFEEEFNPSTITSKAPPSGSSSKVETKATSTSSTSTLVKSNAKVETDENDPLGDEKSTMDKEWFSRLESAMKKQSFIDVSSSRSLFGLLGSCLEILSHTDDLSILLSYTQAQKVFEFREACWKEDFPSS